MPQAYNILMEQAQRREMFIQGCRQHGIKVTPQRVTIFEILQKLDGHPSATDVYNLIRQQFPGISFDTVNRTLLSFEEMGILSRVPGSGEVRRFDRNLAPHHHAHCIRCNRIFDIPADPAVPIPVPEVLKEMTVLESKTVFEVVCPACRHSQGEES